MIPRTLGTKLKKAASQYPVITLTGPRQSGKTTLARAVFEDYAYASLEDPELRAFALEDPRGFLTQFNDRVILDEIQRAPDLFSYIQTIVDEAGHAGQFVLTGSHNFLLLQGISQTLAGRCAIFHLLPFSLDELTGVRPLRLRDLGSTLPSGRKKPAQGLDAHLFRGFYPRIHDKNLPPHDWLKNYAMTYLERDVRDITRVGDLETFRRFMRLCAARSGQLLNFSNIATDCGVSHTTARRWLSVLEASFLVILLRPHYQNFRKRLVKAPKLYFLDPGLLCYLLRIKTPEELAFHAARGAVFETFVVSELYKRAFNSGQEPNFFFWRDSAGHEIDLIIDQGSSLTALEIKSGATVNRDFFKGLEFWRNLTGEKTGGGSGLIYGGDNSSVRNGFRVYAWWNF